MICEINILFTLAPSSIVNIHGYVGEVDDLHKLLTTKVARNVTMNRGDGWRKIQRELGCVGESTSLERGLLSYTSITLGEEPGRENTLREASEIDRTANISAARPHPLRPG